MQIDGVVTHVIDQQGRWGANFRHLQFDPVNPVVFVNAFANDVHSAEERHEAPPWESIQQPPLTLHDLSSGDQE